MTDPTPPRTTRRQPVRWEAAEHTWELRPVAGGGAEVLRDDASIVTLEPAEVWGLLEAFGTFYDGTTVDPAPRTSAKAERELPAKAERELPANAGEPWTEGDDEALLFAWAEGRRIADLAAQFSRTSGSIAARLVRLGAAEDRTELRAQDRARAGR